MAKQSAWFQWCGSLVAFASTLTVAANITPPRLAQDDLYKPGAIVTWLKTHGATADKEAANAMFNDGVKLKKRGEKGDWGPAVKSFCASALYYPAPKTLIACADVQLHSLGVSRHREKNISRYKQRDMISIEAIYRSALAADGVLNALTPSEKVEIKQNTDYLAAFIRAGKVLADCHPLQTYELK